MKKSTFLFFALVLGLFLLPLGSVSAANVQIFRLYNNANGEHLYTSDANEAVTLAGTPIWEDEGTAWYAPDSGSAVYRLYNEGLQNHLYTTDENEVNVLTSQHGWTKDNGGNALFYSGGSVPIYRLYNQELRGLHHLTTDENEYGVLPQHGWTQEGTALYAASRTAGDDTPATGDADISNVPSQYSIQANVNLSGSGTGYHAKILACTATSAVSFGLQHDEHAVAPYTGQTTFITENVENNNPGGQKYSWYGTAANNTNYKLLLAVQKDGTCDIYVNGVKKGSVHNSGLANQQLYLRVEGSGRVNGDNVNATFSDIKLKGSGTYDESKTWGTHDFSTNSTIKADTSQFKDSKRVTIGGSVSGLADGQDWDSSYSSVSGIIQFVE